MPFMQPEIFDGLVLTVTNEMGDEEWFPAEHVLSGPISEGFIDPERLAYRARSAEISKGLLWRISAPGYLDATEWIPADSEEECWELMINQDPSAFTFCWDYSEDDELGENAGTVWRYCESKAEADALVGAIVSLDGSALETDGGAFVYALCGNVDNAVSELEDSGFGTKDQN